MSQKVFFFTTIPGLESVTHLELCEKWGRAADFLNLPPDPEVAFFRGGLEFAAPFAFGLVLNKFMRTHTRTLLRLASFEASHEKDFLKNMKAVDWESYFHKGDGFQLQFSSKSSRLSKKNQIEECLQESLQNLKVRPRTEGTTIFVRFFRDQCQVSLDVTGEGAFRRSAVNKGSIASLRASTAQALLRLLLQGWNKPYHLIDPMCGAGTFLLEALQRDEPLAREFAADHWPLGAGGQEQQNKIAESLTPQQPSLLIKAWGFDQSDKAVQLSRKNLERLDQATGSEGEAAARWSVQVEDLFAPSSHRWGGESRIVILNPPWGKRLPGASQDLLQAVWKKHQPDRLGILIPSHWKLSEIPMQGVRDIPLLNSGVENRFLIFSQAPKL